MKALANIIEKSTKEVVSELYTNNNGSGLFEYNNGNYRQITGTCQAFFNGNKSQARYELKRILGYFDGVNDSEYSITFKDSEFIG